MNLDEFIIYYKGATIYELKYSVNDKEFYYSVFHKESDKVFKYTKEQHEEIERLKEEEYWRSWD